MAFNLRSKLARQSLTGAAIFTFVAYLLSAGLGYLREAATANYFGTSSSLDIFIIAFTIPELVVVIIMSCLPTALIPSLKKFNSSSASRESEYFWSGLLSFGSLILVLAAAFYIFKNEILTIVFSLSEPADIATGSRLSDIFTAYIIFKGIEFYLRGWLFEKKHFMVPVTMGIVQNLIIIASIFLLHERLFVESLAYGWMLSSLVLLVYNGAAVYLIVKPEFRFKVHKRWLKKFYHSLAVIAIIELGTLVYPAIDRYLAARFLDEGYISALKYAFAIILLPNRLFAISVSSVSFPFIADLYKAGDLEKLRKIYADGICLLFFTMSFIGIGCAIFAEDILTLILQRGAFDQHSLMLTAGPLMIFSLGMVFNSLYAFQMRFYYANSSYGKLMIFRLLMLVIKIIGSMVLIYGYKHNGLAVATVIAWFAGFLVMGIDLGRSLNIRLLTLVKARLFKSLLAACVTGVIWLAGNYAWAGFSDDGNLFLKLIVMGILGTAVYIAIAQLFGFREIEMAKNILYRYTGNRESQR